MEGRTDRTYFIGPFLPRQGVNKIANVNVSEISGNVTLFGQDFLEKGPNYEIIKDQET